MSNITTKELSLLKDQLGSEQTLVKKYKMYAGQCTDPQLQTKFQQVAAQHQGHYNTLINQLN